MFAYIVTGLSILLVLWIVVAYARSRKPGTAAEPLPPAETLAGLLEKNVPFYHRLDAAQQAVFLHRVEGFLADTRITGVGDVTVTDLDRALLAASAIIPIAAFPDWRYRNIQEVLLYPGTFNREYSLQENDTDRNILGMVGEGALNGQMVISQQALREGFARNDAHNTGIHEFVHLVDKADGATDGVPEYLIDKPHLAPWLKVMHREIARIHQGSSDLNPYAATNEAEFLAVTAEYFFEKPGQLRERHPQLYELLHAMFGDVPNTEDASGKPAAPEHS